MIECLLAFCLLVIVSDICNFKIHYIIFCSSLLFTCLQSVFHLCPHLLSSAYLPIKSPPLFYCKIVFGQLLHFLYSSLFPLPKCSSSLFLDMLGITGTHYWVQVLLICESPGDTQLISLWSSVNGWNWAAFLHGEVGRISLSQFYLGCIPHKHMTFMFVSQ